jgi:hypothetical protein
MSGTTFIIRWVRCGVGAFKPNAQKLIKNDVAGIAEGKQVEHD